MTSQSAFVLLIAMRAGERKRDKEAAIVQAAVEVIRRSGFHRARMADIARQAGISYGLVYHYFSSKEQLFEAIMGGWWDGLFEVMARVQQTCPAIEERLQRLVSYFLDSYERHPDLVTVFITEISRSTPNLTNRLEPFKRFMALTEQWMLRGQQEGALRGDIKPRYLTYVFLGALETFLSVMVLGERRLHGGAQKQRIAHSILEVFLNGARRS